MVAAAVAAGIVLALAVRDVLRIRNAIESARTEVRSLTLASGADLETIADRAVEHIEDADGLADHSPWLSTLAGIPGPDGQVSALRDLTGTMATLAPTIRRAAGEVGSSLDAAETGPQRVRLFETLDEQLEDVERALSGVDTGGDLPPGPIGDARAEIDAEILDLQRDVAVARERVQAVHRLLVGPTRLLVLGANNAEMSGAAGMPLTASVLSIADGELDLAPFVATGLLMPTPSHAPPGDLGDLFPLHGVGHDFRGSTATANFPSVGPLLTEMSADTALGPVEGVLMLDSVAVSVLVDAVGSIEVDGRTLDAQDVFEELVLGNYQRFGGFDDRFDRYELQDTYAEAVFDAVTAGEASPAAVGDALAGAARGRHVLAWSPDPELEALYEATGAAGVVGPRSLVVAVENMDGNKLDTFIQPRVEVQSIRQLDGGHLVTIAVDVAHPDLPEAAQVPYVVGPTPEVHFVQTVLHLPEAADGIEVVESPSRIVDAEGHDGHSVIQTALYAVPKGETTRYSVRFRLPPEIPFLEVVPSARAMGQIYGFDGASVLDNIPFDLPLDPPAGEISTRERLGVVGAGAMVLLAGMGTVWVVRSRRLGRPSSAAVRRVSLLLPATALTLGLIAVAVAA